MERDMDPTDERRHGGRGYSLEPLPGAPDLPGSVVIRQEGDEALDALLEDLVAHAQACVREFGDFHLALPGGGAMEPVFVRLMIDPRFRALPWKRTHLWLLHEQRGVPVAKRAYRDIEEIILDHADIPPEQALPIDLDQRQPAEHYEKQIRLALEWREPGHDRLDAALLDLSLHLPIEEAPKGRLVYDTTATAGGDPLVMLTPEFLRTARLISVLATGAHNRDRIAALAGRSPQKRWALAPLRGELRWYVDTDSSGSA